MRRPESERAGCGGPTSRSSNQSATLRDSLLPMQLSITYSIWDGIWFELSTIRISGLVRSLNGVERLPDRLPWDLPCLINLT